MEIFSTDLQNIDLQLIDFQLIYKILFNEVFR